MSVRAPARTRAFTGGSRTRLGVRAGIFSGQLHPEAHEWPLGGYEGLEWGLKQPCNRQAKAARVRVFAEGTRV